MTHQSEVAISFFCSSCRPTNIQKDEV
uniref:Uncharacterized protein n=1 Tax=Anguilla anguilla TaxID=7936 RepID=A0A0E9U4C8_ANGAN